LFYPHVHFKRKERGKGEFMSIQTNNEDVKKESSPVKLSKEELKALPGFESYSEKELEELIDSMRCFCILSFEIFSQENHVIH